MAAANYDLYQDSFHSAFRSELDGIVDTLLIPPGGRVLDAPCGNGFYSRRLAERLDEAGHLTALDENQEYLSLARAAVGTGGDRVNIQKGDVYALPFPDRTFDLVWCAQSLISLEAERAVKELHRVLKAGGMLAILETDEYHHILLPWPVSLEAALPAALRTASLRRYGDSSKLAPARKLRAILHHCGFATIRRITYPFDRAAPFDDRTVAFLKYHFEFLRTIAYPHLSGELQLKFDRWIDTDAGDGCFRSEDVELICLNAVYLASPALV